MIVLADKLKLGFKYMKAHIDNAFVYKMNVAAGWAFAA